MLEKIPKLLSKLTSSLGKEVSTLKMLNEDCRAAIARLDEIKPGFKAFLDKAYAYAVFPSVGKAAAVLGGSFGKGEVFQGGKLIGYAGVAQLTIGVQLGGDTFVEVVVFESKEALDRFKQGSTAWAANASVALMKATASAAADFDKGAAVYVHSEGGMMLEAAIGGQHFAFRPAFLGRTRTAPAAIKKSSARKPRSPKSPKTAPNRKSDGVRADRASRSGAAKQKTGKSRRARSS